MCPHKICVTLQMLYFVLGCLKMPILQRCEQTAIFLCVFCYKRSRNLVLTCPGDDHCALPNVEGTYGYVFGDAGRARKIEKQGLHMLTAEYSPASGCVIRHYIDLNCHLSDNLSHDTEIFFLFGIKLWSPYLGFRDFGSHRESLVQLLTDLFTSLCFRQTFCTTVNSFLKYYTK